MCHAVDGAPSDSGADQFEVLHLDRHRKQEPHVGVVQFQHAVVLHLVGVDLDPSVAFAERLGPGDHGLEFIEVVDLDAEVVAGQFGWASHGWVVGDQEQEPVVREQREDQPFAVGGHRGQFVPSEDLAEEGDQVGTAQLVEEVGGHAHRHVVDAVRSGELGAIEGGHDAQPPCSGIPILGTGTDQDFPGHLAGAQADHGFEQAVESDGVGLQQQVEGERPGCDQVECRLEAMFVVVVGAGHDQFVEDDPAGVEAREVEAGADQHEPAAARQLPEAGLGGGTDARCLEDVPHVSITSPEVFTFNAFFLKT